MRPAAFILLSVLGLLSAITAVAPASPYVEWTFADIDTTVASLFARNTLAIDANGTPHVAYMDFAAKDVKYATRDGLGWLIEVVEDGAALDTPDVTSMPSLALDSQGRPHVVYAASRDGAYALIHAVRNSVIWNYDIVTTSTDWFFNYRLALDVNDQPHVVYSIYSGAQMDLHYRTREVDIWSDSLVGEGDQAALVLTAAGQPLVVFRGWAGANLTHLRCATHTDTGWSLEELAYLASWPEIALDVAGHAHLTCKFGSWVYYATNAPGVWTFTPIGQTITDARSAPIAIDRLDLPVIVYPDSDHNLRWAYLLGESWTFDFIGDGYGFTWGLTPSLAFDPARNPRTAFRGERGLQFARGTEARSTGADVPANMPHVLMAWPNPFNPLTTLRFDLPVRGRVRLEVYDVAGRLVRTLLDVDLPAGSHQAVWDGKDERGMGIASGSYFARLQTNSRGETVQMNLVR